MTQVLALGGATCYLGINNRNNSTVYCSVSQLVACDHVLLTLYSHGTKLFVSLVQ